MLRILLVKGEDQEPYITIPRATLKIVNNHVLMTFINRRSSMQFSSTDATGCIFKETGMIHSAIAGLTHNN